MGCCGKAARTVVNAAVGAAYTVAAPVLEHRTDEEAAACAAHCRECEHATVRVYDRTLRGVVSCGVLLAGNEAGACGCVVGTIDRADVARVRAEYAADTEAGRLEALRSMRPAGMVLLRAKGCPVERWSGEADNAVHDHQTEREVQAREQQHG